MKNQTNNLEKKNKSSLENMTKPNLNFAKDSAIPPPPNSGNGGDSVSLISKSIIRQFSSPKLAEKLEKMIDEGNTAPFILMDAMFRLIHEGNESAFNDLLKQFRSSIDLNELLGKGKEEESAVKPEPSVPVASSPPTVPATMPPPRVKAVRPQNAKIEKVWEADIFFDKDMKVLHKEKGGQQNAPAKAKIGVAVITDLSSGNDRKSEKKKKKASAEEERTDQEKIREYWLSLTPEQRKNFVVEEKHHVMKLWKDQQKLSCSCTFCSRKRIFIEEEIELLYDAYSDGLESYTNQLKEKPNFKITDSKAARVSSKFTAFADLMGSSDDYGKKFLEIMDQIAEKRLRQEFGGKYTVHRCTDTDSDDDCYDDDYLDDDEDDEDDEDEDEDYYTDEDYEDGFDFMTEDEQIEEGRKIFQVIAARTFEHRVSIAYREKVALEKQQQLLREVEEEERLEKEREAQKQLAREKKKEKKKNLKEKKDRERNEKEAAKKQKEMEEKLQKEEARKAKMKPKVVAAPVEAEESEKEEEEEVEKEEPEQDEISETVEESEEESISTPEVPALIETSMMTEKEDYDKPIEPVVEVRSPKTNPVAPPGFGPDANLFYHQNPVYPLEYAQAYSNPTHSFPTFAPRYQPAPPHIYSQPTSLNNYFQQQSYPVPAMQPHAEYYNRSGNSHSEPVNYNQYHVPPPPGLYGDSRPKNSDSFYSNQSSSGGFVPFDPFKYGSPVVEQPVKNENSVRDEIDAVLDSYSRGRKKVDPIQRPSPSSVLRSPTMQSNNSFFGGSLFSYRDSNR